MAQEGIRFNSRVVRGFIAFSRVVGVILLLSAFMTFAASLGWSDSESRLTRMMNVTPRLNSAWACLLSGGALLLRERSAALGVLLSCLVAILGGFELIGHVLIACDSGLARFWLGIDPASRMTELPSLSFLLLGVVGIAVVRGYVLWLREALVLVVLAIALAAWASWGLVLGGESANLLRRLPIATAILLLLQALAWMSAVPTTGLTRIAVADSLGGAFARRLILPSLLLPALLTFGLAVAQSRFAWSPSLLYPLAAVLTGGAITALIVWVAFLLDRSERMRRVVSVLRVDADTDALTGLANRRALDAALAGVGRDGPMGGAALLMLDLDRFKSFNDSFGHQAGDEVLRETGMLLRAAVRPGDMVARYGGEEFAILLPGADAAAAQRVGQRVLEAFRTHHWPLRAVTISIGAAVAGPQDTTESLVQRADRALYASKQGGRDRITLGEAL